MNVDKLPIVTIATKYVIQGIAIAIVAFYIPLMFKTSLRKPTLYEVFGLAITAALTMLILDFFSPDAALGARLGVGFEIGKGLLTLS
jgi:inner membrane protein involved in colicin E2 resistance